MSPTYVPAYLSQTDRLHPLALALRVTANITGRDREKVRVRESNPRLSLHKAEG